MRPAVAAFPFALMFMLTLAAEAIIVLCVLTYAMHCLLVVVRETAGGNDEVFWPEEPFQDWIFGSFHLVGVLLIWLAPIGILARSLRHVWLSDDAALRFMLLAVPGLWLFFPVTIFSSLSASSRWFVFRPVVIWNLLRLTPFTFMVYVYSALLAATVAGLGYVTVVSGWLIVAPFAAAAAAAAFLIYARLLGRLGGKMSRLASGKRKPMKKVRPAVESTEANDPWTAPVEPVAPEESDPEWETTPYGRKQRRVKGYGLSQESPQTDAAPDEGFTPLNQAGPIRKTPSAPASTDFDRVIRARPRRPVASKRSFLGGVFTFPWYEQSRMPWLYLSLGFLAVCVAGYALASLYSRLQ
jgi:hypothetical protein